MDDPKEYTGPDGNLDYLPLEHTICISDRWNWFQKKDIIPARTPDELKELFYRCTANDNILLVNLPPDQTGHIRKNELESIFKTADLLDIHVGKTPMPKAPVNQAAGVAAEADSVLSEKFDASKAVDGSLERTRWTTNTASLTLTPEKPFLFNRISIHEYSEKKVLGDKFSQIRSFRVQGFSIDAFATWRVEHHPQRNGNRCRESAPPPEENRSREVAPPHHQDQRAA